MATEGDGGARSARGEEERATRQAPSELRREPRRRRDSAQRRVGGPTTRAARAAAAWTAVVAAVLRVVRRPADAVVGADRDARRVCGNRDAGEQRKNCATRRICFRTCFRRPKKIDGTSVHGCVFTAASLLHKSCCALHELRSAFQHPPHCSRATHNGVPKSLPRLHPEQRRDPAQITTLATRRTAPHGGEARRCRHRRVRAGRRRARGARAPGAHLRR